MKILHTSRITLLILLVLVIVSPTNSYSDISKAFPDMSNVFEKVSFYDKNNKITKFNGYKNKVLLVFFGYTHCPDVCPTTVLDMARVRKGLGDESSKVLPTFRSVDYDRDACKKVDEKVDVFDNGIAG